MRAAQSAVLPRIGLTSGQGALVFEARQVNHVGHNEAGPQNPAEEESSVGLPESERQREGST